MTAPFILRSTHEREMAAKDAEIAGLMAEAAKHRAATSQLFAKLRLADHRYDKLEARLAKFPHHTRPRNERGQFEKDA